MRKSAILAGASLLFAVPFSAMADVTNYSYVQGLYVISGDVDLTNGGTTHSDDFDGFQIKGSLGFSDLFYGRVEFSQLSVGDLDQGDYQFFSAGMGLHHPLLDEDYGLNAFALVSYKSIRGDEIDYDAAGYGIKGGIRWQPIEMVEITPFAQYFDFGEVSRTGTSVDGSRFGVQALFSITKAFAITAVYQSTSLELTHVNSGSNIDFGDSISVGIRYYAVSEPSVF